MSSRYTNIAINERTCENCNVNEVGNEQHLMQRSSSISEEIISSFIQKLSQITSPFTNIFCDLFFCSDRCRQLNISINPIYSFILLISFVYIDTKDLFIC